MCGIIMWDSFIPSAVRHPATVSDCAHLQWCSVCLFYFSLQSYSTYIHFKQTRGQWICFRLHLRMADAILHNSTGLTQSHSSVHWSEWKRMPHYEEEYSFGSWWMREYGFGTIASVSNHPSYWFISLISCWYFARNGIMLRWFIQIRPT